MEKTQPPICWALLIGIDCYPDDDETTSLGGCVEDVKRLRQSFQNRPNLHTEILTASIDKTTGSKRPTEDISQLPTLENVRSIIDKITSKVEPGDLVHIHFSGHGVRRKTRSEDFGDHENGDLALVLYDPISNVRYLQGLELVDMLKKMVMKGLKPVLVLDCCHSGAVLRSDYIHNGKIREAVYNSLVDRQSVRPDLLRRGPVLDTATRDASVCPNWFLDPDGYAILTTCGPDEISRELILGSGSRCGPLSYFLSGALQSMQRRNISISLRSLHDYITVQFRAGLILQNPRRYRNQNVCLLTHLRIEHDPLEARVRWCNDKLILEAGTVHAITQNDDYHVKAPWKDHQPIACKVKNVDAFTSVLEAASSDTDISCVKNGWRAMPQNHLSNRHLAVGLSSQLQLDTWRRAIHASSFLKLCAETQDDSTQTSPLPRVCVSVKDGSEYHILNDSMSELHGLPRILIECGSAIGDVVKLLDHIAKFKYIEGLNNRIPDLEFERSFRLQLNDSKGNVVNNEGSLSVNRGEKVEIRCLNLSNKIAYLSVFNLTPTWRINNLLASKYGDYKDLVPFEGASTRDVDTLKPLKVIMNLPEGYARKDECHDVIKIFITSKPVSLSSLRLPAPSSSAQMGESAIRNREHSLKELLSFFSSGGRASDNTPSDECWLTRNFLVHVSQ